MIIYNKARFFTTVFFITAFLSSCAPRTSAPTPTLTAIPSATPIPQVQLIHEAILFSGPGSDGYSQIGNLPTGTPVTLQEQFGDFVKVETTDGKVGYIISSSLEDPPQSLTQLALTDVPWQDLDLRYNFVGDGATVKKDQITVEDISGAGTGVNNGVISLNSAFRIRMSLHLEENSGEYASIILMGTPPVTNGDWWRGLIRLDIGANQQNKLQLCINDGTSELCNFFTFVEIPTDKPFTVLFDDSQGKVMHILDQNGQEVLKVDISQQTGLTLPNGLFPTHAIWLGAWVNPQAILNIDSFLAEKAPSGKAILEDLPELAAWVDNYVHAYGGQVTVNDGMMDSQHLTETIRQNSQAFTQVKQIDGKPATFLIVNGIPLAIQKMGEPWIKVYGRDLADSLQIELAMPGVYSDIGDPDNREIIKNANKVLLTNDLLMNVVYGRFTADDWHRMLDQWETIEADIDQGIIPSDFPYYWDQADPIFMFAQSRNMAVRAQCFLTSGDSIPDAVYKGGFTKDEIKKILEFTTGVTVIKYKGQVDEWTIENEQVIADLNKGGNEKFGFWMREVGLLDATELVSRTVKKLDLEAKLVVAEAFLVEDQVGTQEPEFREAFFAYLAACRSNW